MSFRHDDSSISAVEFGNLALDETPDVLVVDDDPIVRELVVLVLQRCGWRVTQAEDGLEAQKILRHFRPRLVISDLEMPICDGWQLLAHCHAFYPDIPVLIASGAGAGLKPEIERWASGFFLKPFGHDQLRSIVEHMICRAD